MRLKSNLKVISSVSTFVFMLVMAAIATTAVIAAPSALATSVSASLTSTGYYVSVSSSDVTIDVSTTPNGTVATGKDTLVTKTNVPSGYKLYVSMANSSDYDSSHPGNALYQGGDSTSGNMIPPTTGTISTPAALARDSWGFNAGSVNASSANGTTIDTVPTTFSAMPLRSNLALIQETSSANEEGVKKDIYYGVNATFSTPSGTYTGEVLYTALAETSSEDDDNISISPSSASSMEGGEQVTITTSLYTDYALTKDDILATIGGEACTIASDSDITIDSGTKTVKFTCTTPSNMSGAKDVVVTISRFSKTYTLVNGYTYPNASFWNITYMQDMTSSVCNSATTPNNTAGKTEATIDTDGSHQGDPNYVAQRVLYDIRDGKSYTIRKLADGNCWMTENLAYELVPEKTAIGSYNDGSIFEWIPKAICGEDGECAMNGNTVALETTAYTESTPSVYWYYSWYAATANRGKYNTADVGEDVDGSICPAHWKLPYNYNGVGGQTNRSFAGLFAAYGIPATNHSTTTEQAIIEGMPLDFKRLGIIGANFNSSTAGRQALSFPQSGYYWSSTAGPITDIVYTQYGQIGVYRLAYGPTVIRPMEEDFKYHGESVRCVAL